MIDGPASRAGDAHPVGHARRSRGRTDVEGELGEHGVVGLHGRAAPGSCGRRRPSRPCTRSSRAGCRPGPGRCAADASRSRCWPGRPAHRGDQGERLHRRAGLPLRLPGEVELGLLVVGLAAWRGCSRSWVDGHEGPCRPGRQPALEGARWRPSASACRARCTPSGRPRGLPRAVLADELALDVVGEVRCRVVVLGRGARSRGFVAWPRRPARA